MRNSLRRSSWLAVLGVALLPAASFAQSAAPAAPTPQQWTMLDPKANNVMGISADRAYTELLKGRPAAPVVVAVIDSGVDTAHVDLKRVLWHNPKEIPGNDQDDDNNGYVDDIYGWNFLGGKDGRNVDTDTYEETRLVARLKPLYEGKSRSSVAKDKQAEYDLYQRVKKDYERKLREDQEQAAQLADVSEKIGFVAKQLEELLEVDKIDTTVLRNVKADGRFAQTRDAMYSYLLATGSPDLETAVAEMKQAAESSQKRVKYSLNLAFNPRADIVQDDENNVAQRSYGNADVHGPDPLHGTHVSGIIAADRRNNEGVLGVADAPVRIMAVRAVPDGDEHDKDVANAIRYAVDNGATVINMSFGKYYSPQRKAVEDAIRYAGQKGVLLVHAAGNESNNIDQIEHFPAAVAEGAKTTYPNVLTVGASASKNNEQLAADFSNYGKRVDVFAPGVAIYNTLPGSKYGNESGTSMAAPTVAGVAAVLKSYFPQLQAAELKRIIMQSAEPVHTQVLKPGEEKKKVDFTTLSNTGGVVNLYRAVQLAQQATASASGGTSAGGK